VKSRRRRQPPIGGGGLWTLDTWTRRCWVVAWLQLCEKESKTFPPPLFGFYLSVFWQLSVQRIHFSHLLPWQLLPAWGVVKSLLKGQRAEKEIEMEERCLFFNVISLTTNIKNISFNAPLKHYNKASYGVHYITTCLRINVYILLALWALWVLYFRSLKKKVHEGENIFWDSR